MKNKQHAESDYIVIPKADLRCSFKYLMEDNQKCENNTIHFINEKIEKTLDFETPLFTTARKGLPKDSLKNGRKTYSKLFPFFGFLPWLPWIREKGLGLG